MSETKFFNLRIINELVEFKHQSDIIVANRITDEIRDVSDKVYSRDLFGNN